MSKIGVAAIVLLMFGPVPFAVGADSAHVDKRERPAASPKMRTRVVEEVPPRELILLSESEIRKALIGQNIVLDLKVDWKPNKVWNGIGEYFLPDGSWITSRAVRAVIVEKGLWRIRDGKICTRVPPALLFKYPPKGRPEVCRQVWRDRATGNVAMTDPLSGMRDILIFASSPINPHRLPSR